MKLIVGLGNPGREYEATRHNIGFRVVDRLAADEGAAGQKKSCSSRWAEIRRGGRFFVVAKPLTFMNRSGEAVSALVKKFHIRPAGGLLVILDDADLPFGRFRIRQKGSSGGHKGLESIICELGTADFNRFRIGVGRPGGREEGLRDYVLDPFSEEEQAVLPELLKTAAAAGLQWIDEGAQAVMNKFNQIKLYPQPGG
ncbi:MAG: aminoacyl-tRNA hydrolase [Candidatus Omnitrophica bacterium]|nr:aminoacyl-tRNA hydrolase [Candidatus Omnitrophota bacterium]